MYIQISNKIIFMEILGELTACTFDKNCRHDKDDDEKDNKRF